MAPALLNSKRSGGSATLAELLRDGAATPLRALWDHAMELRGRGSSHAQRASAQGQAAVLLLLSFLEHLAAAYRADVKLEAHTGAHLSLIHI